MLPNNPEEIRCKALIDGARIGDMLFSNSMADARWQILPTCQMFHPTISPSSFCGMQQTKDWRFPSQLTHDIHYPRCSYISIQEVAEPLLKGYQHCCFREHHW